LSLSKVTNKYISCAPKIEESNVKLPNKERRLKKYPKLGFKCAIMHDTRRTAFKHSTIAKLKLGRGYISSNGGIKAKYFPFT